MKIFLLELAKKKIEIFRFCEMKIRPKVLSLLRNEKAPQRAPIV